MNTQRFLMFDSALPLEVNGIVRVPKTQNRGTPKRTIQDYEIVVVTRGSVVFEVEGRPFHVREGEAGLLLPHRVHAIPPGGSGDMTCVHFIAKRMSPPLTRRQAKARLAAARRVKLPDAQAHILPQMRLGPILLTDLMPLGIWRGDIDCLLKMALREIAHPSCNSYQRLSRCLSEVLLLLTRQTVAMLEGGGLHRESGNWVLVQQALFRINQGYVQPLTVHSLAGEMKTTPQTLIRQFRRCLGTTPMQALQAVRLEHALALMRNPELSLKEIGYAVGLRDATAFSRWFRRLQGCSPRAYRQR